MKKLSRILLLLVPLLIPSRVFAQHYATRQEAMTYSKALIETLGWARSGKTRFSKETIEKAEDLTSMLYAIKLANQDFQKGIQRIQPFAKSNTEVVKLSAEITKLALEGLIEQNEQIIALLTAIADGKGPSGEGSLADQLSNIMVESDSSWKLFVDAAIAGTYVMLEPDRSTEKMRLTITATEKKFLMDELLKGFGPGVKEGLRAGQHALDAAGASLYQVLNQPWPTANE